jgi:hypothetical protein
MLEFIEVFWLRDGFDVICGNPPWIKLEFNEANVISDRYPEVAIRRVSAPEVRSRIKDFMSNDAMKALYEGEQREQACSTVFLNAVCNYPLLVGQQTNLYKCVLSNCMQMLSTLGYLGILCPDGIYDDPNGQLLRRELYKRLKYHFQYENELNLFTGTNDHGRMRFGETIYGGESKQSIDFYNMNNVFSPNTIDACFLHDGSGICGGIKDEKGNWNTSAHKDRIVYFSDDEIRLLSNTFEDGTTEDCAKLVSIHSQEILNVLRKIQNYPHHVKDTQHKILECLHETGAVDDGTITRLINVPSDDYEMIYSGPHFYVSNPLYKSPRAKCVLNSDYDNINLSLIREDYVPRSNYKRQMSLTEYVNLFQGFQIGLDENGSPVYDRWIDYYRVGFRKMVGSMSERTLMCAVLRSKTAHIHGVISVTFRDRYNTVDVTALCSSLVLDFYMKTIGASNLQGSRMQSFPLGVAPKYQSALYSRTLLLNCLTKHYADLWEECWRDEYAKEQWSITDSRLKPFNGLERKWSWNTPLRNYFERRQALVEIDVIAAMALGLSLKDLELIYRIQFPVLQQNENDTWYDMKGNIVFTCSRGLTGVGVDRPVWNTIRDMKPGETYVHTIEKSELYKGQQVTYYAPFTRCDRIEDYRCAWAHFEPIFNK